MGFKALFIAGSATALAAACASVSNFEVVAQANVGVAAPQFVEVLPAGVPISTVAVETDSGLLVGRQIDGVNVFRGVPYASPPVGDLRWRAPEAVAQWTGQRAAFQYESACPQPAASDPRLPNQGGVVGPQSEDCLYLQVYAPVSAEKAPVVVWLHGGAAFLGAGHLGSYVGTENAKKGIVTVPINYRLGSLGYFAHPEIDAEDGPTGSFAMMDAVAALEWVRDNISEFGGDPNNVTVAGQSAGGVMVVGLLSTPSAAGLYHKAIVQSGAYLGDGVTLDRAHDAATAGLEMLGVPADATAAQLRTVPAQSFMYNSKLRSGLGPIIDGEFRTISTQAAFEAAREIDVPLLVGSNAGEPGFNRARELAAVASEGRAGAWLYHFDYIPAYRETEWSSGPIHSAELMFTFDTLATSGWSMGRTNAEDAAFAEEVSSCWVAFYNMALDADTLECASGFHWPAFTEGGDVVAVFDRKIVVGLSRDLPDGP